jgi:hypothetical protein
LATIPHFDGVIDEILLMIRIVRSLTKKKGVELNHLLVEWASMELGLADEATDGDDDLVVHAQDYTKSPQVVKSLDLRK